MAALRGVERLPCREFAGATAKGATGRFQSEPLILVRPRQESNDPQHARRLYGTTEFWFACAVYGPAGQHQSAPWRISLVKRCSAQTTARDERSVVTPAEYLLFEPPRLCSRNESRSSNSAFRPFSWLEVTRVRCPISSRSCAIRIGSHSGGREVAPYSSGPALPGCRTGL